MSNGNQRTPEHHATTNHTVVTNPNDLLEINQQQHIQHQLMIHQQQRRRSSVYQTAAQHPPTVVQKTNHHHPPVQTDNSQNKVQDVKVEITEVKQ